MSAFHFLYLQHEFHANSVFDEPHDQVGFALEHLVIFPGQCVGVSDGKVQVGSWTERKKNTKSLSHSVCKFE